MVPHFAGADVDAESASTELSLPVFFASTSIAVTFLPATYFAASFLLFEPPHVSDRLLFAALPFVIPAPPLDPFPAILSGSGDRASLSPSQSHSTFTCSSEHMRLHSVPLGVVTPARHRVTSPSDTARCFATRPEVMFVRLSAISSRFANARLDIFCASVRSRYASMLI